MNRLDFGTEQNPLRASSLPTLSECPTMLLIRMYKLMDESRSKEAADTGNVIHVGIHELHHGKSLEESIEVMGEALERFPEADFVRCIKHITAYSIDERQKGFEVILEEKRIRLEIEPSENDPTKEKIVIYGTMDQVIRTGNGQLILRDIKTGKSMSGTDMIMHYAPQLAAYQLGASKLIGEKIQRACIVRTEDYFVKGRNVIHYAPWTYDECLSILSFIPSAVAAIRRGEDIRKIGSYCNYCPAGGITACTKITAPTTICLECIPNG